MLKKIIRHFSLLLCITLIASMPPVLHAVGEWTYPGTQSNHLDDLDPDFRSQLQQTIQDLEKIGYPVYIGATWRSKERQSFYVHKGYSQRMNSMHCGGEDSNNQRNAYAADVYLNAPLILLPLHARFYHQLQRVAHRHQLRTGATFSKSNPIWALFDLGWDPGHVESRKSHSPICQ